MAQRISTLFHFRRGQLFKEEFTNRPRTQADIIRLQDEDTANETMERIKADPKAFDASQYKMTINGEVKNLEIRSIL